MRIFTAVEEIVLLGFEQEVLALPVELRLVL
jgi:hypothetical protein